MLGSHRCTGNVEQLFHCDTVLRRKRYDRLIPAAPAIERTLSQTIKPFASIAHARPKAFNLSNDPWVEMLVTKRQSTTFCGRKTSVTIIYVSGDRRSQADRREQQVDLIRLLPSKERLAWMLAHQRGVAALSGGKEHHFVASGPRRRCI